MSFKFSHGERSFWAKQMTIQTEIYALGKKGLSELVMTLDGKPTLDEVISKLSDK